jgi:hypothetical protein
MNNDYLGLLSESYQLDERVTYPNKVNAPTFIYWIAYGKYPRQPLMGKTSNHSKYQLNGIYIDKEIPKNIMEELNKIEEIEMRSSCQGETSLRPAFIIFRPKVQNIVYVKKLVKALNSYPDIRCGYDSGNMNKIRIGVTNPGIFYGINHSIYLDWWNTLPGKIRDCLKQA